MAWLGVAKGEGIGGVSLPFFHPWRHTAGFLITATRSTVGYRKDRRLAT